MSVYETSESDDYVDVCGYKNTSCGRRDLSLQLLVFFFNFAMESNFI